MIGGGAPSILVGGAGNDVLVGGHDHDILIGGAGSDLLTGFGHDNLLIGGYTTNDNNAGALITIQNIWTSTQSYTQRVDELIDTGGLLDAQHVFDDLAIDILIGTGSNDLFITGIFDLALSLECNEIVKRETKQS